MKLEKIPNDLVEYFFIRNIKLIGVYDNGVAIASGKDYENAFTTHNYIIANLISGEDKRTNGQKITLFYFRPYLANWVCLDINCKKDNDGLIEFYDLCKKLGRSKELLPIILQNLPNSFPCYVETPNNGYHLYFRYEGKEVKDGCLANTKNIEIKYKQLTAAGSYKYEKPYILHGSFDNIPEIPLFLRELITSPQSKMI
jgi:hypothetical protein